MGAAAARRATKDLDVSKMVQEYEQLYDNLIDHSHRLKTENVDRQQAMSLRET